MATTVNTAFSEFMKNIVNLDPDVVSAAGKSRDNLLDNIDEFDNKDDFFDDLYKNFEIERIHANRMINSNGKKRGAISELLISNIASVF